MNKQEEQKLREEFEIIFISSIGNREVSKAIADFWLKKIAEREAEILAFKGQRSREDYMRGWDESREKLIETIEEKQKNTRLEQFTVDTILEIIKNK